MTKYHRVLLKLSGEALAGVGQGDRAIEPGLLGALKRVRDMGVQLAVVVGGGNVLRGAVAARKGMDRVAADHVGMLGTVVNALVLEEALRQQGVEARVQSALEVPGLVEPYGRRLAQEHLAAGRVVIFAGGTGHPFLTTDTAAALRALEVGAEVLLMGKKGVDGVYDADPRRFPEARKFQRITHAEALKRNLQVMDLAALCLCMENNLPIIVFDIDEPDNIGGALRGEAVGTLVG